MYDVAIIGAGINGCSVAHALTQEKKKVIVFDMEGVASGGSGAAGAFISPKFSKSGELKELLHDAFVYSMEFYEKNFPSLLTKAPLLHIAQDEKDSEILKHYMQNTTLELKTPSKELLEKLKSEAKAQEHVYMEAGVVNAKRMCEALCEDARFVKEKVETLIFDDGMWVIRYICC